MSETSLPTPGTAAPSECGAPHVYSGKADAEPPLSASPVSQVAGRRYAICRAALLGVSAIVSAWLIVTAVQAHFERALVREVWELGGYARRRHERPYAIERVPGWYRTVLGEGFMDPVVLISLAGSQASDLDLRRLANLRSLRIVNIRDTQVGDAGLRHLGELRQLRILVLTGTAVSDAGLLYLEGMSEIEVICLDETQVTDHGLRPLRSLPKLKWLDLSRTRITDAGLADLAQCRQLNVLVVDGCNVSEAALSRLQTSLPDLGVFDSSNLRPTLVDYDW